MCSLDSGFGKVPLCGKRDGHAAVHSVSHAGESSTSGVQPECRDSHQTRPVLCTGRRPQTAGNRSRFWLFFFVHCNFFHLQRTVSSRIVTARDCVLFWQDVEREPTSDEFLHPWTTLSGHKTGYIVAPLSFVFRLRNICWTWQSL